MRPTRFKANIIVWNLPEGFTGAQLAELFDEHGLVLGATVKWWEEDPDRTARGLVDLAPEAAVDRAIQALDGHVIGTRKLKVRRVREAAKPPHPAERRPGANGHQPRPPAARAEPAEPAPRKAPIVEYRSLPRRRVIIAKP